MMRWLALFLASALLLPPLAPAFGFGDEIEADTDQDRARDALAAGAVRPYGEIRDHIHRDFPGRILDVQLQGRQQQGPMTYDVRVLRSNGDVLNVRMDARSGHVLGVERPDR